MEVKHTNLYKRKGIIYIDATLTEIGRVRFSTKLKDTKENMAKALLSAKDLVYTHLGLQDKEQKHTFKSLGQQFLKEECQHTKAQTLIKYEQNLKDISKYFKHKDLRLITQEQILAYAKENATQSYKIAFLNRLVRFALSNNLNIQIKPLKFKNHYVVNANTKKVLPLSLGEIKQVLESIQEDYFRNFLQLAFFTGMRTGELMALQWQDCDFENNKILVNKSLELSTGKITSTKTHQSRYIDMLPQAKLALLNLKNVAVDSETIFTFNVATARNKWHKVCERLGLEKRCLYQTRHSFATMMLTNNEEPLWVSSMLGHKSLQTTFQHYVKYIPQNKKRASFLDNFTLKTHSTQKDSL